MPCQWMPVLCAMWFSKRTMTVPMERGRRPGNVLLYVRHWRCGHRSIVAGSAMIVVSTMCGSDSHRRSRRRDRPRSAGGRRTASQARTNTAVAIRSADTPAAAEQTCHGLSVSARVENGSKRVLYPRHADGQIDFVLLHEDRPPLGCGFSTRAEGHNSVVTPATPRRRRTVREGQTTGAVRSAAVQRCGDNDVIDRQIVGGYRDGLPGWTGAPDSGVNWTSAMPRSWTGVHRLRSGSRSTDTGGRHPAFTSMGPRRPPGAESAR